MPNWKKLSALLRWVDRHPVRKLAAYIVASALGIAAIVAAYVLVRDTFFKTNPLPTVIRAQQLQEGDLEFDPMKRRVEVLVENPSEQSLLITGALFRVVQIPDNYAEEASAPVLPNQIYKLPLDCNTESGATAFRPAYEIDPKSSAAFILEGEAGNMACLVFLSFETSQGRTEEKLAEGF